MWFFVAFFLAIWYITWAILQWIKLCIIVGVALCRFVVYLFRSINVRRQA